MIRTSWRDSKFVRSETLLYLDYNECCDSGMVDNISKFLKELPPESLIRYPDLKKAYTSLQEFGLDPDAVLLTGGAEHAIRAIIDVHRDAWSIAYPWPTYGMLQVFADIFGLAELEVPYSSSFELDYDKLVEGEIIYLANPDCSTGTVVGEDVVRALCDSGNIVILDETYYPFGGNTLEYLLKEYDNMYIIRSFSKAYGVAGIRLGMILSNKENISKLIERKPAYEINSVACEYLSYLARNKESVKESVARVASGKSIVEKTLRNNGYRVKDTHANFVLVDYDAGLYDSISKFANIRIMEIVGNKYIRVTAVDTATASKLIASGAFNGSKA